MKRKLAEVIFGGWGFREKRGPIEFRIWGPIDEITSGKKSLVEIRIWDKKRIVYTDSFVLSFKDIPSFDELFHYFKGISQNNIIPDVVRKAIH
jgi:hypothetical protein